MPINIEIKARISDWDAQIRKVKLLASSHEELIQEDVFFNCPQGRLKLRMLGSAADGCGAHGHAVHARDRAVRAQGGNDYLVFYRRPDISGPKASEYEMAPIADTGAILHLLSSALGESYRVRKRRMVFHFGQTRIHFDEVEGLGRFIELEVVLKAEQTQAEGQAIAGELMGRLGIEAEDLIEGAYADLVTSK